MAKKVQGLYQVAGACGLRTSVRLRSAPRSVSGVNIMEFCKQFNAQTQKSREGTAIPVIIHGLFGSQLHLHHEYAAVPRC